ncbi:MAG: cytosine permease [Coleofasciculaceae cyanobacterium]
MSETSKLGSIDRSQAAEDYPLSAVPFEGGKYIWSLAPLLIGFTLSSASFYGFEVIGSVYNFETDLILITLLGTLLLGVYAAALGYIAAESGLSTVLMARFSFGTLGSRWVSFLLALTQLGRYGWGSVLIAELLNQLVGLPPSFNWLVILFFTYAFCSTAYMGYLAMDGLSRLVVPGMLVLMMWSFSIATGDSSASVLPSMLPKEQLSLVEGITIIFGMFVSSGTQATNWSRFACDGRTAVQSTLLAFFLCNSFLLLTGAYCLSVYGQADIVQVMAKQGLLVVALVLLFLNMWTTQDKIIYSFSLASAHLLHSTKRNRLVFLGATIALVFAWLGIYKLLVPNLIIPYLKLLSICITPIGGVIITDYWLHRQGQFPSLKEEQPAYNWVGIFAYAMACGVSSFVPGVTPIYGFITAAVLYFILSKLLGGEVRR